LLLNNGFKALLQWVGGLYIQPGILIGQIYTL